MKITDLAKAVCREEGKKVEINIAQVAEILRVLAIILVKDEDAFLSYVNYAKRLAKTTKKGQKRPI